MPRKDHFDRHGRYSGSSYDSGDFRGRSNPEDPFMAAIGGLIMLGGIIAFCYGLLTIRGSNDAEAMFCLKLMGGGFVAFWIGLLGAICQ
ncbi:MAG: hypothetical protein Q7S23_03245 [bacterium]|nr:hypothetical protein [bacterium]